MNIPFSRLAEMLQEMSDTTKRTVKLNALETFIREIIDYDYGVMKPEETKDKEETITSLLFGRYIIQGRNISCRNRTCFRWTDDVTIKC